MTLPIFAPDPEPERKPQRRRDAEVWETNWCFTHGFPTAFARTCEGFRLLKGGCDVAPAEVRRTT